MDPRIQLLTVVIVATLGTSAAAQTSIPAERIKREVAGPLAIGLGYQPLAGQTTSYVCVEFDSLGTIDPGTRTPAADVRFDFKSIENAEEMLERLEVDAAATFGVGAFGGSAAAQYVRSTEYSSRSLTVIVRNDFTLPLREMVNPRLNERGRRAAAAGVAEFLTVCGFEYVSGQRRGGRLRGVMKVETSTHSDLQSARVAIGGGGPFGSFSAAVNRLTNAIGSRARTEYTIATSGGWDTVPSATRFADAVRSYGAQARENPAVVVSLTRPYRSLEGLPTSFRDSLPDVGHIETVLDSLAKRLVLLIQDRNAIKDVQRAPSLFNLARYSLVDSLNRANRLVAQIEQAASICRSTTLATSCALPEAPVRVRIPPWVTERRLQAYRVTIRTSTRDYAGTDARVFLAVRGSFGRAEDEVPATRQRSTGNQCPVNQPAFENGREDVFTMNFLDLGEIQRITLRNGGECGDSGWYVDWVDIYDHARATSYRCRVGRWLARDEEGGLAATESCQRR